MRVSVPLLCSIGFTCWSCCFGQSTLSLSSASAEPGAPVTLNISLNTAYPGRSSALQWTINAPAGDIASMNTAAGPVAQSAQKSLYCENQTCLLVGINTNALSDGVVATVTLKLSPTATGNLVVELSNAVEALSNGSGGSIQAANGMVSVDAISVAITPVTADVYNAQTLQLAAAVAGSTNSNVTWAMNPQMGTLSNSGLYTAPAVIATTQPVMVTATSVADQTKSATATLTLYPPISVSLSPSTISLQEGQTQEFSANVMDTSNPAVVWSINPAAGSISNGKYTAPHRITEPQSVTITATSAVDSSKSASATITLLPFQLRGPRRFPRKD